MYEIPLIFVFGGWGFGVGESIFCIGVLDVGVLSLALCPEIMWVQYTDSSPAKPLLYKHLNNPCFVMKP